LEVVSGMYVPHFPTLHLHCWPSVIVSRPYRLFELRVRLRDQRAPSLMLLVLLGMY
jgi:hypothetical protein